MAFGVDAVVGFAVDVTVRVAAVAGAVSAVRDAAVTVTVGSPAPLVGRSTKSVVSVALLPTSGAVTAALVGMGGVVGALTRAADWVPQAVRVMTTAADVAYWLPLGRRERLTRPW